MGEYATRKSDGADIKIGTCESMYYLRADQAHGVTAGENSLDPIRDGGAIRFRFPFPDEDHIAPGEFRGLNNRGLLIPGLVLKGLSHGTVHVEHGKNASRVMAALPCPFTGNGAPQEPWVTFTRNMLPQYSIVAQRVRGAGVLAVVIRCEVCDSMWSLVDLGEVTPVLDALQRLALDAASAEQRYQQAPHTQQRPHVPAAFWVSVLDRATRGYVDPPAWARVGVAR